MSLNLDWGVGNLTRHWALLETTYNTHGDFAATDAFLPMERPTLGGRIKENILREDIQGSLGHSSTRQGRQQPISFSYSAPVRPFGSAGTPPDTHPFWYSAFSKYTNTGSTADAYENDNTVLVNTVQYGQVELSPYEGTGSVSTAYHGWEVGGIICDSFKLGGSGTDLVMEEFSGTGASWRFFHTTTLDGALSGSESSFSVASGTGNNLVGDSVWKVGFFHPTTGAVVDDNSGSGYTITSTSTDTWNVSPNIAGAVADGSQVLLIVPGETVSGVPMQIGGHAFTHGGASLDIASWELEITTGSETKNDEFTSTEPHDAIRSGKREARSTIVFHRRNDRAYALADHYGTTAVAQVITIGSTAGEILTINLDSVIPDGSPDEGFQDIQSQPSLTFLCLEAPSAAGDEVTATFT
jgi:hypothetical protein